MTATPISGSTRETNVEEVLSTTTASSQDKAGLLASLLEHANLPLPSFASGSEGALQARDVGGQQESTQAIAGLRALIEAHTEFAAPATAIDAMVVDQIITAIDAKLQAQLDEILHHLQFQELESAWRGLKFLVDRTDFRKGYVRLEMIDVSKAALAMSFEDAPELIQSGLYKHVYVDAYDTPGADPYGAMVTNFEFDNSPEDVALLQQISKVSAAAHCPFIASVGPRFFGKESMAQWKAISDLSALLGMADYAKWRSLRSTEEARYLGLVFPRFLLRPPYGPDHEPVKSFTYAENVKSRGYDKYLWGNATFAFASNLVRAFVEDGYCVCIRGPEAGGRVENLPVHYYGVGRGQQMKIVTEAPVEEELEYECANLGFIPFSHYQGRNAACFFSANSVQSPAVYDDNPEATANSKINARLPYIFLASRIAHYMKVMQREHIGKVRDKAKIEDELNTWIKTLVTKMKNPGADQIAKTPLNDALVRVHDFDEAAGFYQVEMMIKPHFQIEGMDIHLSLLGKLPKAR